MPKNPNAAGYETGYAMVPLEWQNYTTGDEQFKVEEKPPEEETVENGYGNVSREKYQFENKYNVPQFGDHNSSTRDIDDTNA